MATVQGNVEALSRAILGEARAEIEDLMSRAQARAESIRQRAQEAADREQGAILAHANQEKRRLRGQTAATAQLKARSLELEHREQLLEKVFRTVAERLSTVPQRKDYDQIVVQLAREALSHLRAESAVLVADVDARRAFSKAVLDEISKAAGAQLTIGEPLESGAGMIAQTPDGRLHFDNTFQTRLARLQGAIRSAAYRVLMGEAE